MALGRRASSPRCAPRVRARRAFRACSAAAPGPLALGAVCQRLSGTVRRTFADQAGSAASRPTITPPRPTRTLNGSVASRWLTTVAVEAVQVADIFSGVTHRQRPALPPFSPRLLQTTSFRIFAARRRSKRADPSDESIVVRHAIHVEVIGQNALEAGDAGPTSQPSVTQLDDRTPRPRLISYKTIALCAERTQVPERRRRRPRSPSPRWRRMRRRVAPRDIVIPKP